MPRFSKGKVHECWGNPFVARQKAVPSRSQTSIIASILKAIDGALRAGFQIVQVLALMDRQEGGREKLQKSGYELESLYTTEDLMRVARQQSD